MYSGMPISRHLIIMDSFLGPAPNTFLKINPLDINTPYRSGPNGVIRMAMK